MNSFHCNLCYSRPTPSRTLKYFLTSCGHSFCNNCGDEGTKQCRLCGRDCSVQPISDQLPENLKMFFSNIVQRFKIILKALLIQRAHYKIFIQERVEPLESNYLLAREKLKQKESYVHQLQCMVKALNAEYEKLIKELEAHSKTNYASSLNRDLAASNMYTRLNLKCDDSGCGESVGQSSSSFQTPRSGLIPPMPSAKFSTKTYAGMPGIQKFVMSDKPAPLSTGRLRSSSGSSKGSLFQQQSSRRGRKSGFFPLPNNPNLSYF